MWIIGINECCVLYVSKIGRKFFEVHSIQQWKLHVQGEYIITKACYWKQTNKKRVNHSFKVLLRTISFWSSIGSLTHLAFWERMITGNPRSVWSRACSSSFIFISDNVSWTLCLCETALIHCSDEALRTIHDEMLCFTLQSIVIIFWPFVKMFSRYGNAREVWGRLRTRAAKHSGCFS